jgi:hypothetical protein
MDVSQDVLRGTQQDSGTVNYAKPKDRDLEPQLDLERSPTPIGK